MRRKYDDTRERSIENECIFCQHISSYRAYLWCFGFYIRLHLFSVNVAG